MPNGQTRLAIIAEATRVFLARGYDATNLDDIARNIGVSKKTIYKEVGSKAELFQTVASEAISKAPSDDLLARLDDGDPHQALRSLLLAVATVGLSEGALRFYGILMRKSAEFPKLPAALEQITHAFAERLDVWFEKQKHAGWLRSDMPTSTAEILLTLLIGRVRRDFLLGLRQAPDSAEVEDLVDTTLDIVLSGILARPK